MAKRKWRYPDPSFKGEKWYEWTDEFSEDEELTDYIYALLRRHSLSAGGAALHVSHDAALVPLLCKLVYIWKIKKYH